MEALATCWQPKKGRPSELGLSRLWTVGMFPSCRPLAHARETVLSCFIDLLVFCLGGLRIAAPPADEWLAQLALKNGALDNESVLGER